jgi:hypothetical protein
MEYKSAADVTLPRKRELDAEEEEEKPKAKKIKVVSCSRTFLCGGGEGYYCDDNFVELGRSYLSVCSCHSYPESNRPHSHGSRSSCDVRHLNILVNNPYFAPVLKMVRLSWSVMPMFTPQLRRYVCPPTPLL